MYSIYVIRPFPWSNVRPSSPSPCIERIRLANLSDAPGPILRRAQLSVPAALRQRFCRAKCRTAVHHTERAVRTRQDRERKDARVLWSLTRPLSIVISTREMLIRLVRWWTTSSRPPRRSSATSRTQSGGILLCKFLSFFHLFPFLHLHVTVQNRNRQSFGKLNFQCKSCTKDALAPIVAFLLSRLNIGECSCVSMILKFKFDVIYNNFNLCGYESNTP